MQDSSTAPTAVLQFRQDLQAKLREGVRRAIEAVLKEELLAALGADDLSVHQCVGAIGTERPSAR